MKKRIIISIRFIGTTSKKDNPPQQGLVKLISEWLADNYDKIEGEPSYSPITITVEDIKISDGGDVIH